VLVGYDAAARQGLERAWFAQVPLDPSRSRVVTWYLYVDRLYCVTDSGLITALNAETGAQLWTRQVGKPGAPAFGPEANGEYIGVISGSRLYILEQATGRLKFSREVGSAPSSGPALSSRYAFVALVTGRVEGYDLEDPDAQPWYYQSNGRTFLRPTTTGSIVSWPTTEGYLYVSNADPPGVRFRLATGADIVTSPAEMSPYLYIASLDGYLYCLNETNGREVWRYSTGYPIMSSPALVADHAFVASIEPELHCVAAKTGQRLWSVAGVSHFCAQGKGRVYASDRFGSLVVLDAATGEVSGRMRTAEGFSTLVNDQTDRIFLVNDRGLVQCLREIGAAEPTIYRHAEVPEEGAAADAAQPDGADAASDEPAPEPAADGAFDADATEMPPEEPADGEPAEDAGDNLDNPFDDI
jgi:outer membrane protein assembly factor BamB